MFAVRRYSVTGAIDAAVRLYRSELGTLLAISLVVAVPNLILNVAIASLPYAFDPDGSFFEGLLGNEGAGQVVVFLLAGICGVTLLGLVVLLVFTTIGTAASTLVISAAALGRHMGVGEAFREALPRFGTLLLASLLTGLITMVGFSFCILPGLIAWVALAFVGPIVVLEGIGAVDSLRRSWELAKDRLVKIFAAMLLVWLVITVLAVGTGFLPTLLLPESLATAVGTTLLSQLTSAAVQPLLYATLVVLYYDARVEQEAFDVEMLAASAGEPGTASPSPYDGPPAPY